jgi:hypothetical protein
LAKTMLKNSIASAILLFASVVWNQEPSTKYPWQAKGTHCNESMSFCWYGSETVSDPEVIAYGNRWVSTDKDETPLEWVTQVRCIHTLNVCILARNQKLADRSITNTDMYRVEEWSSYQIRAIGESDWPRGKECEIDSLLLNRAEASVSMLSTPGPGATSKGCTAILKPKTVVFTLELGVFGNVKPAKP